MTGSEITEKLKGLPDLYLKNYKKEEAELPDSIEDFLSKYYFYNTSYQTYDKEGNKVCDTGYSRSLSEIYQIVKAKYEISFSEFLDKLISSKLFDFYDWKCFIACKSIYKVTVLAILSSSHQYSKEGDLIDFENKTILYREDFHEPGSPFEYCFSDLEKSIYYLIKTKLKK